VVVSAGLGGTASRSLQAKNGSSFAPLRLSATRLSIGLRVRPRATKPGKTVTYVLRISNVGSDSATLLQVCDRVPSGLTLVSAPPHFTRRAGGLVCRTFAGLPVGGTAFGNFKMRVSSSAPAGVIVNTATARATGGTPSVSAQARLTVLGPCPSRLTPLSITRSYC
jgi:uncharacterized repeat protein (TIGR01451 family)